MAIKEVILAGGIVLVALYAQATSTGKLVAVKTMGWSKDKVVPTPTPTADVTTAQPSAAATPTPPTPTKGITEKGVK